MSDKGLTANDPRLTEYALGELAEAQAAEVERQLEHSPELHAAVDEIRKTAALLAEAFLTEPSLALDEAHRARVEASAAASIASKPRNLRRTIIGWAATVASLLLVVGASAYFLQPRDRSDMELAGGIHAYNFADRDANIESRSADQVPALQSAASGRRNSTLSTSNGRMDAPNLQTAAPAVVATGGRLQSAAPGLANTEATNALNGLLTLNESAAPASGPSAGYELAQTEEVFTAPPARNSVNRDGQAGQSPNRPNDGYLQFGGFGKDSRTLSLAELNGNGVSDTRGGRLIFHPTANEPEGRSFFHRPGTPFQKAANGPVEAGDALVQFATMGDPIRDDVDHPPREEGVRNPSLPDLGIFILHGNEDDVEKVKRQIEQVERQKGADPGVGSSNLADGTSNTFTAGELWEPQEDMSNVPELEAALRGRKLDIAGTELSAGKAYFVPSVEFGNPSAPSPGTESYAPIIENKFLSPRNAPLSTFSIDVDTGSYANVRRFLNQGQWPPRDAVRIEELVNYFHYDDPAPVDGKPFSVHIEVGDCPWAGDHRLVRIGIKGKEIPRNERPASSLVFLIDVSGSMRDSNKLPLVKSALRMLVDNMTENDRIAIVTYATSAGVLLNSTPGSDRGTITTAIAGLSADGSTNGEAGIKLAYDMARTNFIREGANRVILCTDGDFNVGQSDDDAMVALIRREAHSGVFLSVFGFGMGNLKDSKLEQIADKGNGHYGYIDNLMEARKAFVEEMTGTLYTIAKDVKLQIEFNPSKVGAYRLIGYDNRVMPPQDFHNDRKDAGDVGAGHSVTALYEIVPPDKLRGVANAGGLKYQKPAVQNVIEPSNELLTLQLRYKEPDAHEGKLLEVPVVDDRDSPARPSRDFQWSAAVSAFGMLLRSSPYRGNANLDLVLELASNAAGPDPSGRRRELIDLVYAARALHGGYPAPPRSTRGE